MSYQFDSQELQMLRLEAAVSVDTKIHETQELDKYQEFIKSTE